MKRFITAWNAIAVATVMLLLLAGQSCSKLEEEPGNPIITDPFSPTSFSVSVTSETEEVSGEAVVPEGSTAISSQVRVRIKDAEGQVITSDKVLAAFPVTLATNTTVENIELISVLITPADTSISPYKVTYANLTIAQGDGNYSITFESTEPNAVYVIIYGSADTTSGNPGSSSSLSASTLTATSALGQVSLSWTAVTGAAGYLLVRSAGSEVSFSPVNGTAYTQNQEAATGLTAVYVGSNTSYSDSSVATGTSYYYQLFAFDSSNNYSNASSGTAGPLGAPGLIDGDAATGINVDTNRFALAPALAVHDSALYVLFAERNPSNVYVARVKKYDGSSWSIVDGNTNAGISTDATGSSEVSSSSYMDLVSFNSKLIAGWNEVGTVRVKAYDGSSWSFIDGGSLQGRASSGSSSIRFAVAGNALYATWVNTNGSGKNHVRVSRYDGTTWTAIDGDGANGLIYDVSKSATYPEITAIGSHVYVAWSEGTATVNQIRVMHYDGSTWSFIDGGAATGLNKDTSRSAITPSLTNDGTNIYLSWTESNGSVNQMRVAKYNGSSWSYIDGNGANGINKDVTKGVWNYGRLAYHDGSLYATWGEDIGGGVRHPRLAKFDGTSSWSFVDGDGATGLAKNQSWTSDYYAVCSWGADLILGWTEYTSTPSSSYQVRVYRK